MFFFRACENGHPQKPGSEGANHLPHEVFTCCRTADQKRRVVEAVEQHVFLCACICACVCTRSG